ncbi:formamidopyrimidine-DNA glycosylase [Filimonas zeae]|nr:DNA-formamidopyrimidine glycosylase family protein [Filimonas zeae]MDR6337168.1 formamidopyrimidine-DNA glycosylase [Filimonas zeae]
MPELPDLQVFSSNLTKQLAGKTLERITISSKKTKTSSAAFKKALQQQKLTKVYREGKELRFAFANGHILGMHLMLHGQLHFFTKKPDKKYVTTALLFTDGTGLALSDYQGAAVPSLDPEEKEAPDALSKQFTAAYLQKQLAATRSAIKNVLLDQQVVRGIGNAYADEILWQAGISPFSVANKIPAAAVKKLARIIPKVLKEAEKKIRKHHPDIISGEIRDFMQIHNAHMTQSPNGAQIQKKAAGGRKTYYTDEQELFA